jgi:hypothetical protein
VAERHIDKHHGANCYLDKDIRHLQQEFKVHSKLNLKIVCNAGEKNPFGRSCRDNSAKGCQQLNFLVF